MASWNNYTHRLFGNPVAKIKRYFRGHHDGSYTVRTEQDVTDLVEANKALFNLHDGVRFNDRDMGATVARIPLHIYFELERLGIAQDDDAFGRWLDDPDNKVWRIMPGRVRGTARQIGA